jgi:Fe-S-cluster-containing hydrogenase component 2
VDAEKCYGCGVCRSACEYEALRLVERVGAPQGLLVTGAATA